MTVIELLAQLGEKNVRLSVKGDDLVVRGKEKILEAPALLELLRKNKKTLVEHIKAGKYVDPDGVLQVPPNRIPPDCKAITPEMLPLAQLTQAEIDGIVDRVPGGAPNIQDIYPLGPLQEGMLFHHLLGTEGDIYLTRYLLAFASRALLDKVLQVVQAVIDRHDILRTAFLWEGLSEPVQVVWRKALMAVEEVAFDPTAGDVAGELYARFDPRRYRLDISQAPLMRVYIAEDAPKNRWVMLHLFHHLSVDHVSFEIFLEEIQAHLLGLAEELPAPLPFRNFVAQARLGVSQEEHERFFREMLWDVDEPTAPYGLIDVHGDGPDIREARREVDAGLARRLRQTSKALEVSVASLYHLAWALVLGRVSGRDDVVFGTVLFGRMQGVEGSDRALGMLLNTLPMRIRINEKGVGESVRQTHQLLAELMRHEHASLALAKRCSGIEASAPLFSAPLNYRYGITVKTVERAGEDRLRVGEGVNYLKVSDRSNYPFNFSVDDVGEGFVLGAHVQSPADPDRICAYMHTALEQLVEALEHAPASPVQNLEVLPVAERHQLLMWWNATEVEYLQEARIHRLFEAQAEKRPEAIALVYEDQSLTYGELNVRANRLAHYLRTLGVGPESRVAICLERSLEMVVALLATLKAGGAYVPLDPAYPPERLSYMLEDSAPAVLLTHDAVQPALASHWSEALILNLDRDVSQWAGQPERNPDRLDVGLEAQSLAYVIYTSGSTGQPKGVMISHRAICNRVLWTLHAFPMGPQDCLFQKTPYSFDASVWEIFAPLLSGARLLVARPEGHRDSAYLCEMIVERQVTVLQLVPSMLRVFLREREVERCASLVHVFCGGEELRGEDQELFRRRLGARLHNLYGPTEVSIDATHLECEDLEPVTIGRPLSNVKVYILDSRLTPAPMGVPGELHVGGVGLARGYLNRPDLSGEKFIPDPHGGEAGARLYKTGDQGRWMPDGTIEYLGRNDSQVKIRGFRIELGEIEAALGQHPSIGEAVVLAREDRPDDRRLVAYVVPKHGRAGAINGPPGEDNFRKSDQIELWPCVGEYQVYDELLYYAMTKDERRNNSYKAAIDRLVKDKVVLDLGAGKDVIWARYCVEAGARRVYAVEILDEVCEQAEAYIKSLGLQEKIVLIRGDSTKTQLPEKVDVCVSNVIGTIGSSEGVVPILNDARRFLREDGVMIPQRVVTKIAAVCLPEELQNNLGFPEVAAYYAEKVFNQAGGKFDLRLCLRNFPGSNVISEAAVFEDLEFKSRIEPEYQREVRVTLNRNSRFDGFLLWLNIQTIEGEIIDNFEQEYSWLPVYVPVFYPGVEASVGDRIEAVCSVAMSDNGLNPDYRIEGSLIRKTGEAVNFRHDSFHHKISYKKTPFYQTLFAGDTIRVIDTGGRAGLTNGSLRAYLQRSLPAHTIPSAFVTLDALPLTPNGKVDRRALPAPEGESYLRRDYEAPLGERERKLARIWAETLKLERVGRHDNFFELGGHSLLVITVIERMRREGMRADVRTLFTAPTLRALAETIKDSGDGDKEVETPANLIPEGCQRITPEMLPLIALTQAEIDSIVSGTPGGAANIQDIYPLAPLQEGMLFHHLISAEGDAYLMWSLLAFDTRELLERFVGALQAVIDRHDILRTAVVWDGLPEPVQVVWREAPLSVEEQTLNPEDGDIARQLLTRFDPKRYRMDLAQAPLIRMMIAKDAAGQSWGGLLLCHHLLGDNTSQNLVMAEVHAHLEGRNGELAEPLPFRNFVAQARLGISREEHEAFFREMLGGVDEPTAPFGLLDAQRDGSGIKEAGIKLDMGLSRRLREQARMMGVSVASLCHLAWAMALARVSGRDDVVFGTVLFGRIQGGEGADKIMGPFINTLPIRIRIDEEGVGRSAKRTHRLLAELIGHEHASLALAQRCSGVEAPAPLFSSLLNYRHSPQEAAVAEAETVSAWTGVNFLGSDERTNYPLTLSIDDLGEGLALTAQTVEFVDPRRVNELVRTALERLAEALENEPERAVRAIEHHARSRAASSGGGMERDRGSLSGREAYS